MDLFTKEMIAPCGLDCSVCIARLEKTPPCPGCWSKEEGKPEHCARLCEIAFCEHRKELKDGYCDKCPDYPCAHILKMENKYQHDYPLKESLMDNLAEMRRLGMDEFLRNESEKWCCVHCGGIICVHTGNVSNAALTTSNVKITHNTLFTNIFALF